MFKMCQNMFKMQVYLSEAVRVLRPGGHFYISWYPSWQSGRGHHIHPDMVPIPMILSAMTVVGLC